MKYVVIGVIVFLYSCGDVRVIEKEGKVETVVTSDDFRSGPISIQNYSLDSSEYLIFRTIRGVAVIKHK